MSEVIMILEEPWYNTLTEQMFKQVIEEIQPEPFIVSPELDNEINKAVLDLLHNPHEGVGLVESTELYKMLLPNISMGGIQFATIYYYD